MSKPVSDISTLSHSISTFFMWAFVMYKTYILCLGYLTDTSLLTVKGLASDSSEYCQKSQTELATSAF